MRKLERWWGRLVAEWRIRHRRRALAGQLKAPLKLDAPLRLVERGNLGHDSNYDVIVADRQIGVLRLNNPFKHRPLPPPEMPFRIGPPPQRIDREWDAYTRGAPLGLTPTPLWRDADALLCDYLPYGSLRPWIQAEPERIWEILALGGRLLDRLHCEVGLAHMDASIDNILCDPARERLVMVDFEYMPSPGVSFAQQRIFDHLRLVQSGRRLMAPGQRHGHAAWLEQLAGLLDEDMRAASFDPIRPGLREVLSDDVFRADLGRLFAQPL